MVQVIHDAKQAQVMELETNKEKLLTDLSSTHGNHAQYGQDHRIGDESSVGRLWDMASAN